MTLKSAARQEGKRKKKQTPLKVEEKSAPQSNSRTLYFAMAAILAAVFISYANSLGNEFVFDDLDLVVKAIQNQRLSDTGKLVSSYRPVRTISYALDYLIWGERAFGFHLTNILLHAVSSIVVFMLLRRLTGALLISLLGALIFALHPLQTDSVTYISGRRDILFGLFYMAAFLSYLSYTRSRARLHLGLMALFWALSLLSKEMAVSFPLVIFLWNFCHLWSEQEGSWLRRTIRAARSAFVKERGLYVSLITIDIAYSLYSVLGRGASQRTDADGLNYYGGSLYYTLLTSVRAQAWYLKQLVFPTPIVQYYGAFDVSRSISEWRVLGSIALVGSALGSGLALLRYNRLMAFAILAYFAMLAPVSQIIPHHEFAADHYLYLPIMCFSLLVVLITQKLTASSRLIEKLAYATVAVAVIVFVALTVMQNRVWKDSFTLWQDNYQMVPTSSRAAFNLAGEYEGRNLKRAEELLLKSIELDKSLAIAYTKLSKLYLSQNRLKEAEEMIERGLAIPDQELARLSGRESNRFRSELLTAMAAVRNQQGRFDEAERTLEESLDLNPSNTLSRLMLASRYKSVDKDKYLELLKEGAETKPLSIDILQTLAGELIADRKYEEAIFYLNKLADTLPESFYAHYQLGRSYRLIKDCPSALRSAQAALDLAVTSEEVTNARELVQIVARECGGAR